MFRATATPVTEACIRPRVIPAPSPMAIQVLYLSVSKRLVHLRPWRSRILPPRRRAECFWSRGRGPRLSKARQAFDDAGKVPVGQDKGKVAGNSGLQGGDGGGFLQAACLSVRRPMQQVAQALHHNAAAGEHVAQLGDIAAVFNGLVKRLGEVGGNQHGEVGVFRVRVPRRRSCGR